MLLGADVLRHYKSPADALWHGLNALATAHLADLADDALARDRVQPGLYQRLFKSGAGVGQLQVLSVVVDVPHVGQRKDRLAAISLAPGHGSNGPRGSHRRLRRVADAVFLDALYHLLPVQLRPPQVAPVGP